MLLTKNASVDSVTHNRRTSFHSHARDAVDKECLSTLQHTTWGHHFTVTLVMLLTKNASVDSVTHNRGTSFHSHTRDAVDKECLSTL